MSVCAIVGKPNVGKTLFFLHFALYLGARRLELSLSSPEGETVTRVYEAEVARRELVGPAPHTTLLIQGALLPLPVGKVYKQIRLVDTVGLSEGISDVVAVRKGMADTLREIRGAGIILHVVDASRVKAPGAPERVGEVDLQIAAFGSRKCPYTILANKMDLPGAPAGLAQLRRLFSGHSIIPISALQGRGFKEVKQFVLRHI